VDIVTTRGFIAEQSPLIENAQGPARKPGPYDRAEKPGAVIELIAKKPSSQEPGNVGFNQRKEYTIIGDVVNMVEGSSRRPRSTTAAPDIRCHAPKPRRELAVEDLSATTLKGQTHPARIFKVA